MNGFTSKTFFSFMAAMMTTAVAPPSSQASTFGDDLAFLQQHTDIVVLRDRSGQAKVAVSPAWQGRVMTSTAEGDSGLSRNDSVGSGFFHAS